MLKIAILIGLYSYAILALGLLKQLFFTQVLLVTIFFVLLLIIALFVDIKDSFNKLKNYNFSRYELFVVVLLGLLVFVSFIGALGPELAFDSLWYHLTIPKIFIQKNEIFYIQGNLFYYSLMPKLVEMLYTSSLILSNEIAAKIIHFLFGIFTSIVLFKLCRLYLKRFESLLVVILFYSNMVVMWLSITAFSDLGRAFFEIFSFYFFLIFAKKRKTKYLFASSLLLGLAIATKVLAIGSLFIFVLLLLIASNRTMKQKIKSSLLYTATALTIPLPWFVISYLYTKNPVFPLFSQLGLRNFTLDLASPLTFIKTFFGIFLFAPDPVNPMYIILFPLVLIAGKKLFPKYKILIIYSVLSYLIWYITSQSGGTRFLTAYLPAYSLLVFLGIVAVKNKMITKISILTIIFISVISIMYRGLANAKYIPVLLGLESKEKFLLNNLNFSFGDFYDENGSIKKIVGNNTVLMKNTHNLFYVDFPFTIDEWKENYVYELYQNEKMPKSNGSLIYKNLKTRTYLYKL